MVQNFKIESGRRMICVRIITHRAGGNRKHSYQSRNMDQKPLETVFLIAIYRQSDYKWQSKTQFLTISDLHSLMVLTFLIAAYPVYISLSGVMQAIFYLLSVTSMSSIGIGLNGNKIFNQCQSTCRTFVFVWFDSLCPINNLSVM